jgi:polyhydroxyalkanoate synthesis repressor PhaR
MRIIKRYSNRKLYDIETVQYTTLQKLAALVRDSEVFQVVDYRTGQDLTGPTLAQIIVDEQKRDARLPVAGLLQLIRNGHIQ